MDFIHPGLTPSFKLLPGSRSAVNQQWKHINTHGFGIGCPTNSYQSMYKALTSTPLEHLNQLNGQVSDHLKTLARRNSCYVCGELNYKLL